MQEQTLIIIKPDALQRGIAGEIINRFEKKGIRLAAMKLIRISEEKARYHYAEHKEKPFFQELVGFITSSPVILIVAEGDNVIQLSRKLAGATKVEDAAPGTIRGDYALHTNFNLVHTSDSEISSKREIENFFNADEIISYQRNFEIWI